VLLERIQILCYGYGAFSDNQYITQHVRCVLHYCSYYALSFNFIVMKIDILVSNPVLIKQCSV